MTQHYRTCLPACWRHTFHWHASLRVGLCRLIAWRVGGHVHVRGGALATISAGGFWCGVVKWPLGRWAMCGDTCPGMREWRALEMVYMRRVYSWCTRDVLPSSLSTP